MTLNEAVVNGSVGTTSAKHKQQRRKMHLCLAISETIYRQNVGNFSVLGRPDSATVVDEWKIWFEYYNPNHHHNVVKYFSQRIFREIESLTNCEYLKVINARANLQTETLQFRGSVARKAVMFCRRV